MSKSSPFDRKYWNLAQASAWVEFREKALVERLEKAVRDDYVALGFYPTMWPADREQRGAIEDLRRALEEARLLSWGYQKGAANQLNEVPAAEWADMSIRPPLAQVSQGPDTGQERWTDIRVLSSDMKRLWRSLHEVSGRTKFDWPVLQKIHEDLKANNPAMSQNELIEELQGTYRDRFNKEPPGRTTIQSKMKTWL